MANRRVSVNFSESVYRTLETLAEVKGKSISGVLRDANERERSLVVVATTKKRSLKCD